MKKISIKIFFIIVPVFVFIWILNSFYVNTNYWKDSFINGTLKFKDVPEHIQLANVGSSHGIWAFNYTHVPYQSFNFGLGGQWFIYDYAILRQYINRFDKNAVLLIPISYFQITRILSDFRQQRPRYYRFLDKQYMDFYSLQEKILFTYFPVLAAGNTLRYIIKDQPPEQEFKTETVPELIEHSIDKHRDWTTDNGNETEEGEKGVASWCKVDTRR